MEEAATLEGTVALITGGAKRVGRAIALELARAGCGIAVHYRESRREAEQLAVELAAWGQRAVAVPGDLGDASRWPAIVQQTVDGLGRLDILINNASVFLTEKPDTLDGFDPALWDMMLRVNLTAPVGLSHHAYPHLRASGRGRIVNLLDASADRMWPNHLAYCASKAGLAAMTRGLARALAPDVRVYGVAPGIAVFPEAYDGELRERLTARVPLGREGTPGEVARLVRFLVESGDYITGETIRIDGGRHLL